MATVFLSYSHADEFWRKEIEKQLSLLCRQGVIKAWSDRCIEAGSDLEKEIDRSMRETDIFLLLISSDFLASDYCYNREMYYALGRSDSGNAIVIPVILRACDWHSAPFGKLLGVPQDGKPVTLWEDKDAALAEVAYAVRRAAERLSTGPASSFAGEPQRRSGGAVAADALRIDLEGSHWMIYPPQRYNRRQLWLLPRGRAQFLFRGWFQKTHEYKWKLDENEIRVYAPAVEYVMELVGDGLEGHCEILNPYQHFSVTGERLD